MSKLTRNLLLVMTGLLLLACSLGKGTIIPTEAAVPASPVVDSAINTQTAVQPSPMPSPTHAAEQPAVPKPSAVFTPTLTTAPTAAPPLPSPTPAGLPAPALISPADGTVFNNYPRTTTLAWKAVTGARKYEVEIEGCSTANPPQCFPHPMYEKTSRQTNTTTYTFNFLGKQPGRWRVWAVDGKGLAGTKSEWWRYSYTK